LDDDDDDDDDEKEIPRASKGHLGHYRVSLEFLWGSPHHNKSSNFY